MAMQPDAYRDAYREEAAELLGELETTLLELEENPANADLVARAFRALHTIKGSGAMFGFDAVASFTHEVETVFEQVRNGAMAVTKELINTSLAAKDLIRAMLNALDGEDPEIGREADRIVGDLRQILRGEEKPMEASAMSGPSLAKVSAPAAPAVEERQRPRTYRVRVMPKPDFLRAGADAAGLFAELRGLGPCAVVAHTRRVPRLSELDPESCQVDWDVILTTERGANAIRDSFIFVEDQCDLKIEVIDDVAFADGEDDYKKLGEILVDKGEMTLEEMNEVVQAQKRFGELAEERGLVPSEAVQAALVEQQAVRDARAKRESAEAGSSIRVAAEKLDSLVDRVGELVIAQARLSQISGLREDAELLSIAEEIERLTAELRDNTLNIRMLPIGTTFGKFRRLVRDLSGELGKEIDLVTEGAATELDKTVIERLGDPLVHLIRNSVDHGIEAPDVRVERGKPPRGTVRLAAYHSGPNVFIEITDDGAGLDPDVLRGKALEKGLIAPDAKLSEKELYHLIFLPGFSTAEKVSNVSGRGVGMDVVKRSIDALRGNVEIESRRGSGATIRIKLPLTLAIIEGLLVTVGAESYALPLSLVEECVELTREDVAKAHGRHLAPVRGELVPYIRLREWFRAEGELPEIEQIVIAGVDGSRFGFVVDHVIGQHQTVIKALGRMYQGVEGLSGATILGDGTVALILDIPKLVKSVTHAAEVAA